MSLLKEANKYYTQKNFKKALEFYLKAKDQYNFDFLDFQINMCKNRVGSGNDTFTSTKKLKNKVVLSHKINTPDYEGRIESFKDNLLTGWLISKKTSTKIIDIKILIDGTLYTQVKNNIYRGDLKRVGKSKGEGGFQIAIPPLLLSRTSHIISICMDEVSANYSYQQDESYQQDKIATSLYTKKVSIIVPIYNAVDDVKVCIERLIKYTDNKVDIILINDASPDKKVNVILEEAKDVKNIRIFHNEKNLGFTKTVNRGIKLAKDNDVILLNSDARVTPRWIEGMRYALSLDEKIATVTPMSDRAGAFSAPKIGNENALPRGLEEEKYAVLFRRNALGLYPTVPTGNGFCMYIRRSCIDEIGILDANAFPRGYGEENDFCMRARKHGWKNIIDDKTYIFHDRQKSFEGEKDHLIKEGRAVVDERYPDYKKAIGIFSTSPLIAAARFKAQEALNASTTIDVLPRGLFVISTLTGGTPQTNRDLMLALIDKIEPWLLHCDSKTITLYKVLKHDNDKIVEQYQLLEPVDPLTHTSHEYDKIVNHWLHKYDFSLVHIRHIAWHSLSLPKLAKLSGARVVNSFHDYYSVCPTVKLLDDTNTFCNGECTATKGACKPDLWDKDAFPSLKENWVYHWREKFETTLQYCDAFITTHQSAKDIISKNLNLNNGKFHVIPHGRDFENFYNLAHPYKNGDVLKILVPGNISEPKGSLIIKELLEIDTAGKIHFHILGRTNIKFTHPRLTIHGEYKREDFYKHVEKIKPHIGAIFSIWNETWAHTVTELWSCGIPVLTTDYETLKDRVKSSKAGWYYSDKNIKKFYKFIINEISDEKVIQNAVKHTLDFQQKNLKIYQNKEMANKYLDVYQLKGLL